MQRIAPVQVSAAPPDALTPSITKAAKCKLYLRNLLQQSAPSAAAGATERVELMQRLLLHRYGLMS